MNKPVKNAPSSPCARGRAIAEAKRIFGDVEKAERWLRKPNAKFDGSTPLSLLGVEAGIQAVEESLIQIDHGIFT